MLETADVVHSKQLEGRAEPHWCCRVDRDVNSADRRCPFVERTVQGQPWGGEDLLGPEASYRAGGRLAAGAVPVADEDARAGREVRATKRGLPPSTGILYGAVQV